MTDAQSSIDGRRPPRPKGARRWARWLVRLLLVLFAVIGAAALAAWLVLRGSLPHLSGERTMPGLGAAATVSRDALGVVTVEAANEADAARALGFVHAQERYFEMDLARRSAAGELSSLLGPQLLPMDRERRSHRMRARLASQMIDDRLLGDKRAAVEAYANGVNAGLEALAVRPWPYLMLRQAPKPWTAEDTMLAGLSFYFNLQGAQPFERLAIWRLSKRVPKPLFEMLTRGGTPWEAPLFGGAAGSPPLPGPEQIDLRRLPANAAPSVPIERGGPPGSNNLAVAGSLTSDGRAIVGGDMHLGLGSPGYWFRARLIYSDGRAPGGKVDVSGFTFPGIPAVIAGSNGQVAWSLTNSYVDALQWAQMPPCTGSAVDCGIVEHGETIEVAGGASEIMVVRESAWGPVLAEEPDGSLLALRWVAHLPGAVGTGLTDFAIAHNLDQLFTIADRAGAPAQNLVAGDRNGSIAWRLLGALPDWKGACVRSGLERIVVPFGICPPWEISTAISPQLRDPINGRLWTANNRVLGGEDNVRFGYIGRDSGARARQIRDALLVRDRLTEKDILAIQLDDRALFLEPWWRLLRDVIGRTPGDSQMAAIEEASRHWDGHASVESVSYLLARQFHGAVQRRVVGGILGTFKAGNIPRLRLPQIDGWLWPMVTTHPMHLLPGAYSSWEALLEAAAADVARDSSIRSKDGAIRTWGSVNRARICHPLARAVPDNIRPLLCLSDEPLPGDHDMPRVQEPAFGASQRMAVAPGHETDGFIQMPGGQSDHPLSPFWGAGHDAWVSGQPAPFLPGKAQHVLTLRPLSQR